MLGAVHLGVLAACVVLLVPMGMAGWHLSRNKMLFFSGALFITLAVCVHLTPYFPAISTFVSSISLSTNLIVTDDNNKNRQSCISHLHNVVFNVDSGNEISSEGSWSWVNSDSVNACEFQKLGRSDSSDLLNGSWVVVAGDSQARLLVVSLLGLIMGEDEMGSVRGDLFKRHSDYHTRVDEIGLKLDFIWAPYVENLTGLVTGFKKNRNYPDVLVMGAGLWHMLHVSDPSNYGSSLRELRKSMVSLLLISHEIGVDGPTTGYAPIRSPHVFWLGMPTLINSMLNTEEKREKMQDSLRSAYEREVYASNLLQQSGGPLLMLDIESLSKRCGKRCTADGMHYDGIVYEAAVHILLNALLIESHQKL